MEILNGFFSFDAKAIRLACYSFLPARIAV
jgi:hypothetical protein